LCERQRDKHECEADAPRAVSVILRGVEPFYREFGDALRAARAARGLSQEALATGVGLSRTSVANIERGRQRIPLHLLIDFARVLDVEPAALLPQGEGEDLAEAERHLRDLPPDDQQAFRRVLRRAQQDRGDDDA